MRLVLLHALPLDGRQWSGQIDILPGRTVAPTLYACGDSIADWASGALEAAGDGPLIVVGNSVGGSVALEMARQAGDRIEALVLIGTKAGHRAEPDFRDRFIAALERDRRATVRKWVDELLAPATAGAVRQRLYVLAESQSLADLVRGVRVFHGRPDGEDVVAGWRKPLVVIGGEHDRTCVPLASRPNERRYTLADCGHYVNLERPAAFDAILTDVVKRCIGGEESSVT